MNKKWLLKEKYPPSFAAELPDFDPVILQLLYDRGLDNHEKIDEFLNPDYTQNIHDPFLFLDMQRAVERIQAAFDNQEKILIHGDYDADGVTASVLLESTLKKLGAKDVTVFIPHREVDGYGLNLKNCQQFVAEQYQLVITVDCGITNFEQIAFLKQAGIDTIITDHHLEPIQLPPAFAIINCSLTHEKYPFKKLAGVGVAFKLAQALFRSQPDPHKYEAFEKWLLDLVTIGTIGDMSPILGENRTLAKYGLMVLNKTPRRGLQELIHTCSLSNGHDPNYEVPLGEELYNLSVRNVSFQLVPRLNAAGRIDHANLAYNLLQTTDELEAIALARDIHEKNLERQKIAEVMITQAEEMLGKIDDAGKILIAYREDWLPGVVGLVAGKLADKYSRPVILLSRNGDTFVGSGRSIPEFNITLALEECDEFLAKYGGHSQACGLTIEGEDNYQKFVDKIKDIAATKLKDVELIPTIEVDAEVQLKDLDWPLWDELEKFEPFAEANSLPLFLIKNLTVDSIDLVGKDNQHLRFSLSQAGLSRKAISFFTADSWNDKIKSGDRIDAVVEFGINEWNGNRELQFKVIDWH